MVNLVNQWQPSQLTQAGDAEAIRYLEQAIASGKHWYIALLEAVGLWRAADEVYNGRTYHYLIAGEAFDWLLLVERLYEAVDILLPDDEKLDLLFHNKPPVDLTAGEFKGIIGGAKYHQHLNYFYGITVEEALILMVQEEVRKERRTLGYNEEDDNSNEVYRRIYGATRVVLLRRFRREKGYPLLRFINLSELKEFTYWLFKYRLEHCEKARVASDTKRALEQLRHSGTSLLFPGD